MECLLCLLYLNSGGKLGVGFRVSGFPYISRIHRRYRGFRTSILGTWIFWWTTVSNRKQGSCLTPSTDQIPPTNWCGNGMKFQPSTGNCWLKQFPQYLGQWVCDMTWCHEPERSLGRKKFPKIYSEKPNEWQWKVNPLKIYFLLKVRIFHLVMVSFEGG